MKRFLGICICAIMLTSGCVARAPEGALQLKPESLAERQLQTRRFETTNKQAMLSAAASTLQDLGFVLDESEYTLGVLVASKNRDATSGGQVAGAILLAALTGAVQQVDRNQVIRVAMVMREIEGKNAQSPAPTKLTPAKIEEVRKAVYKGIADGFKKEFSAEVTNKVASNIADSVATSLAKDLTLLSQVQQKNGESTVRITFQRVIYNTAGQITLAEQIVDPVIYQEFFEKLSKSVFLEAHAI